eukprot:TRINITY_DN46963_c0_g1_i1.p1 TRINITY_DN46963_c0_g1~~TRINITY_DN46963_c0_g1_i1.p1  ORF type:complete len:418 (-),score=115.98 TRINITY_DN46963_c0_g1_i1:187-1404(-)
MPNRYFENPYLTTDNLELVAEDLDWKPRIRELVDMIIANQKTAKRDLDGGLYVGVGGVAYMLWCVSTRLPELNYLEKAKTLAEIQLKNCQPTTPASLGFLLGNTGIFAVNAAIARSVGDPMLAQHVANYKRAGQQFLPPDPLGVGSDEMLVGRAGYLAGYLWLKQTVGVEVLTEGEVFSLCDQMVSCGREYSRQTKSGSPLMYQYYKTEYLGAAHGLAGILQVLLSIPNYLISHPDAEQDVKNSVDFLLSIQTAEGNFPCAMDELGENARHPDDDLVHWCHGAPGTVYLLARAHLVWKDEKYLSALRRCADLCWEKGLLKKGPGICHGIAGTGYVFLLMFRLTGEQVYLTRATRCAQFLFSHQFRRARTPDCPLSLYEGWAGTVCFLLDLLQPEGAAFPFSEVFM